MKKEMTHYGDLLGDIKTRISQAQIKATLSANAEMTLMYWDIGRMIVERQQGEGWGAGVLRRLANDLKSEIPEVKGFSERNLKRMTQFYREYPGLDVIGPLPVAQLEAGSENNKNGPLSVAQTSTIDSVQRLVARISWAHNILLIQQVKKMSTRLWYMSLNSYSCYNFSHGTTARYASPSVV